MATTELIPPSRGDAAGIADIPLVNVPTRKDNGYGFRDGQNSWFRRKTAPIGYPFARKVYEITHWSPHVFTVIGLAADAVGTYVLEKGVRERSVSGQSVGVGLKLFGGACDWYDGIHARANNLTSDLGNLLDAGVDRVGETIAGGFRQDRAFRNGDPLGQFLATVTTIAMPLSSIGKSAMEKGKKKEPNEFGNNFLQRPGNRGGRFVLNLISPFIYGYLPEVKGVRPHMLLEAIETAATVNTFVSRIRAIETGPDADLSPVKLEKQVELAKRRYHWMLAAEGLAIASSVLVPLWLRRRDILK